MDYSRRGLYIDLVLTAHYMLSAAPSFYAPSHKYRRLAFGSYGFGHTNLRQPGDLRGTPVGIRGRFRVLHARGGDA